MLFKYRDWYLKTVFKYSLKFGYLNVLYLVFVIFQILPRLIWYNFQ